MPEWGNQVEARRRRGVLAAKGTSTGQKPHIAATALEYRSSNATPTAAPRGASSRRAGTGI